MTVALLFPGQGAEAARMGLSFAKSSPALFAAASAAAGVDVVELLARGGPAFSKTEVLQPLLVATGLAACRALAARGVVADVVLGHSLGEVTAWAASGAVDDVGAVAFAGLRGRAMAREAALQPGSGMSVVRAGLADVERLLATLGLTERVAIAAENAIDEVVLAGTRADLALLERHRPTTRLSASGAWHSQTMAGAVDEVRAAADALVLASRSTPTTTTTTTTTRARLLSAHTGTVAAADDVPALLAAQLTGRARFRDCLESLVRLEIRDVVVLAPARVGRALCRRVLGERIRIHGVDDLDDADATARALLS